MKVSGHVRSICKIAWKCKFDSFAYLRTILNHMTQQVWDQGQVPICIIHKPQRQATLVVRRPQSIFYNRWTYPDLLHQCTMIDANKLLCYRFWMVPGFLLKRMVLANFKQQITDVGIADSVDFMVERVSARQLSFHIEQCRHGEHMRGVGDIQICCCTHVWRKKNCMKRDCFCSGMHNVHFQVWKHWF